MEDPSKLYQQGFNSGYLISKYDPELAKQLPLSTDNPSEYLKGIISGKQEHEIEKIREQLKKSQNNTKSKNIEKDFGKNR